MHTRPPKGELVCTFKLGLEEPKTDAAQRDWLIKNEPNLLFPVLKSPPTGSVAPSKNGLNREIRIFRCYFHRHNLLEVKPAFGGNGLALNSRLALDPLSHYSILSPTRPVAGQCGAVPARGGTTPATLKSDQLENEPRWSPGGPRMPARASERGSPTFPPAGVPRRATLPDRGRSGPGTIPGSIDLVYCPAIPCRFLAWIRRPHSARSLHAQGPSSSALVAAILRASSSSSAILRCASVCHRWEGGVSPRKP